jgi:hypothetical protein
MANPFRNDPVIQNEYANGDNTVNAPRNANIHM